MTNHAPAPGRALLLTPEVIYLHTPFGAAQGCMALFGVGRLLWGHQLVFARVLGALIQHMYPIRVCELLSLAQALLSHGVTHHDSDRHGHITTHHDGVSISHISKICVCCRLLSDSESASDAPTVPSNSFYDSAIRSSLLVSTAN